MREMDKWIKVEPGVGVGGDNILKSEHDYY